MKNSRSSSFLPILLGGLCGLLAGAMIMAGPPAYGQNAADPGGAQSSAAKQQAPMQMGQTAPQGKVTKVEDNKKICMVTNRAYDKEQIPVTVSGKTYYGCCEMCKSMLTGDPSKRMAVDPVSNKKVDKSEAVIGVAANGGVIYFQNDKDLEAYNGKVGSK